MRVVGREAEGVGRTSCFVGTREAGTAGMEEWHGLDWTGTFAATWACLLIAMKYIKKKNLYTAAARPHRCGLRQQLPLLCRRHGPVGRDLQHIPRPLPQVAERLQVSTAGAYCQHQVCR